MFSFARGWARTMGTDNGHGQGPVGHWVVVDDKAFAGRSMSGCSSAMVEKRSVMVETWYFAND